MTVPRLVVAAPSSGSGKTSVATGLLAAFVRRGLVASPHKVGPDYIDPGYHALAAGRPGRNLDPWLVGEDRIVPLFLHGSAGADIAVVEGVMGLFDGAATQPGFASTAHVATLLAAPVVLVVDGSSQSRSVAALVHGFATFDPSVRVAGVVLNKVGSARHEMLLTQAVAEVGLPVFGVLPRQESLASPSRHLGLVPAAERDAAAVDVVGALADVMAERLDLDGLISLAQSAPPLDAQPWDPTVEVSPVSGRPRIAVAAGPAFTFSYAENSELLAAAGADVVSFDPLHDPVLPEGTEGLVIGGGFPEVYGEALSANVSLRDEVATLARDGGSIAAECAGLLYLSRSLDGLPMCGVVEAHTRMTPRLTLGYRSAVAVGDSSLACAGTRVNGHEFHRTVADPGAGTQPGWQWSAEGGDGFVVGNVHASYLHLNWAGTPQLAQRFVAGT